MTSLITAITLLVLLTRFDMLIYWGYMLVRRLKK